MYQMFSYQSNQSISFDVGASAGKSDDDHINTHIDDGDVVLRSRSMNDIEMNRYRVISNDSGHTDHTDDLDLDLDVDYHEVEEKTLILHNGFAHPHADISFIRSFLRFFLVLCTALVAAFIPNIGLLVSLAGASSGTSLALIFPPLLEVSVSRQQQVGMSLPRLLFCVASIGIGCIGAILGTTMSLNDIYAATVTFKSNQN